MAELDLCHLRLQRDARWPWLVLVPARPGLTELLQLSPAEWTQLRAELDAATRALHAVAAILDLEIHKLNVGALGNVVPQLHVHLVGRRHDDPAWPGPVWGFGEPQPFADDQLTRALEAARHALSSPA